jgi:hypothetical protein
MIRVWVIILKKKGRMMQLIMVENFEYNKVPCMSHDLEREWEVGHDQLIYSARIGLLKSMMV